MTAIPILVLDPIEFGRRIVARRGELGMRQCDLMSRARVGSNSTLVYIERGRNLPTLDLAVRIADALGWTLDELVGRAPLRDDVRGSDLPDAVNTSA